MVVTAPMESRARYKKICRQEDINELEVEGRVTFKFKCSYKNPWTTLGYLRFEPVQNNKHPATRPPMSTMAKTRAWFTEELYLTQEKLEDAVAAPRGSKVPMHTSTSKGQADYRTSLDITTIQ